MRGDPWRSMSTVAGDAQLKLTNQVSKLSTRVAECAGQCCDPQIIFCFPLPRNDARHRSTTSPRGISYVSATAALPRRWLRCVRWSHPTWTCCQGSRERMSVTKRKFWSTKVLGRNRPGGVVGGTDKSCSTRGTQFHARLAPLGCGASHRKLECDG